MKQISVFHKGVISDLDYSKLENDVLVFPTSDIRITNMDGKGLIVTPIDGNEKVFELTDGFVIFGACQYNGIAYIISYNSNLGLGEIGSFPSPKEGGGFEEVYKPLMNLFSFGFEYHKKNNTIPLVIPMRSGNFNFDLEHPVGDQMIALPEFDGTISLVFTDGKNALRLVNSGFNQEGEYKTNRFYWEETLKASIELIKGIPADQHVEFVAVAPNGNMPHGNYFFFYRYLDYSNNPTVFIGESQPISVHEFSDTDDRHKIGGDDNSNSSIILRLSNLDISFAFIELAYVRFYSGVEGIVLSEIQRVGKLFPVPPGGQIEATVTGFETLVPLSIASILEPVNTEVVCESIIGYDRRLWGANWKGKPIDFDMLREAALQIKLGYDDKKVFLREDFHDFYAQPENTKFAGYFRGEAYSCKVSFKLKGGYETEAFPVKGIDARELRSADVTGAYNNHSPLVNDRGIIIMPTQAYSPIDSADYFNFMGHILGITYDVSGINSWMEDLSKDRSWFKDNVSEIIFLRAERKPNLMYQGLATRVFGRKINTHHSPIVYNGASIPIMVGKDWRGGRHNADIPTVFKRTLGDSPRKVAGGIVFNTQYSEGSRDELLYTENQSSDEVRIRGVFSTDYIFGSKEKLSNSDKPWIRPLAVVKESHELLDAFKPRPGVEYIRSYAPNIGKRNFYSYLRFDSTSSNSYVRVSNFSNVHNSTNWIYPNARAPLGLVNRARDAARNGGILENDDHTQSLFYHRDPHNNFVRYTNRNIQVPPYFGFELPQTANMLNFNECVLVNVYKFDPNSDIYYNLYRDELNLLYYKINEENFLINKINDIPNVVVCYQGDAFLQSTIIKSRTWFPTEEAGTATGNYDDREAIGASISHTGYAKVEFAEMNLRVRHYAHGELLEIFSENEINTALRVRTIDENTFYPNIKATTLTSGIYQTQKTIGKEWWAIYPYAVEPSYDGKHKLTTGIESFRINFGNSKTTSLKPYLSLNPNIPKGDNLFPNRIRYSEKQEPNIPILAYRMWSYNAKRDFDERYGPMLKIYLVYGSIITVQRSSILLHFTNQEEAVPSTTGEMIIGVRSILSASPITIAKYGSQHKFSILFGRSGLYGWDWMNGVIWRVSMIEGGSVMAFQIDQQNMIKNYVKDLRLRVDGTDSPITSNILRGLKDLVFAPINKEGIVTGYDLASSEFFFSVFWVDSNMEQHHEILRFADDLNAFIGTSHFPAMFFFNIHRDMFAVGAKAQGDIYVHNRGEPAKFFGENYSPKFSFIVNGTQSTRSGATVSLFSHDKHFKAIEIESPKYPFPIEKVEFETMFQRAQNNPLYNESEFWLTPEYLMSKWAFPINISYYGQDDFNVGSNLMGKWMKVTVTLNKGINTFVKNVITLFTTKNI